MQAQEWKALLEKYYRGESTLEEERRLKGYLAGPAPEVSEGDEEEPPADAHWFADLQKARAEAPGAGFDQALLAALRQTGPASDVDAAPPGRFRKGKAVSIGNWAARIAAVLVAGVGLAWALYLGRNEPAPWREQKAAAAQTVPVTLPDGTRVWLNAGSTLRYPGAFAGDRREVHLRGEAYFEVEPDAARPFRVHADQSVTEVLGTAFNVRNYPGEASVSVVVVSGKVAFASLEEDRPEAGGAVREKVLLLPGNGAQLHRAGNALEKEAATDPNRLAWKTQRLVFRDLPLRQVIPVLENYYHTRIAVPNPAVLDCRFRGTFRAATLPQVLEVMAFGLDLTYARQPGGYVLTGRGCQP